jgi:uncharacterized protein (DUF1810 family)
MRELDRHDPFHLQRFLDAQAPVYAQALEELRAGEKRTHWCWFVLPQIQGLGRSEMAARYAVSSLDEARAYLAHPVLGPRLRETIDAINAHTGTPAERILGHVDALKFHSCVTLFAQAAEPDSPFHRALAAFFAGAPDRLTLDELARQAIAG